VGALFHGFYLLTKGLFYYGAKRKTEETTQSKQLKYNNKCFQFF